MCEGGRHQSVAIAEQLAGDKEDDDGEEHALDGLAEHICLWRFTSLV
jgi:RNase adaptor protein for sRNA GlmZ degradation